MVTGTLCCTLALLVLLALLAVAGGNASNMTSTAQHLNDPDGPPGGPPGADGVLSSSRMRRALHRRHDGEVVPSALGALVVPVAPPDDVEATVSYPGSSPSGGSGARAERSANLSHIAGAGRKIMMYVRNRHLQILPDGTVNGTDNEGSDYAVLQRTSVNKVQVKMQGIATCLFLCMDACGLLYGSKELTDDCVFNEMLEQHYYNTYSSAKYSTGMRSLYLALDRRGASRRVQLRRGHDLAQGRLATYTRVLTKPVPAERVSDLLSRLRGQGSAPHFRHRGHHAACPPHGHPEVTPRRPLRCPRPGRHAGTGPSGSRGVHNAQHAQRKHLRRRPGLGTAPSPPPSPSRVSAASASPTAPSVSAPAAAPGPASPASAVVLPPPRTPRRKCEATEDEDLCHKRLQNIAVKKRKSRNEKKHWPHHKRVKVVVKKAPAATTTSSTSTSSTTSTTSTTAAPDATPGSNISSVASVVVPGTENATLPPPTAVPESEPSEEDDHEAEDEEEDHDDSATMTTEVATTMASLEDSGVGGGGSALADDP